jgi:hypothetical protein
MEDLTKQQEHRARLLRAIYDAKNGSTKIGVNYAEKGAALGLSRTEIAATMDYLVKVAGWARYDTLEHACMTAAGVEEIERTIKAEQPADALTAWRRSCEAKTIAELQDGLDRGLYNKEKANIARTVLEAKQEQRREQGEVAALKKENDSLKQEVRDKKTTLFWTRVTTGIAAAALLVSVVSNWRSEIGDILKSAVAAVKGPANVLALDVAPLRFDEFRPTIDKPWVFHQFSIRVRHPAPNALSDLRAEITAMEPHRPMDAPLPLLLRVHQVGIHEAIVDVVRVNVNWLETGPIQWCGKLLLVSPPDDMKPGIYAQAQVGFGERGRYVLTITVAAGGLSANRRFTLEPGKPTYTFMALE